MKNSVNKKRTTVVLYIINYAVSIALLIVNLVTMFNFGYILSLTTVLSYLTLFTINTILLKKWYHFLGYTFQYTLVNIVELIIIYCSYNSYNHSSGIHLPADSVAQILFFCFIHICTIFFLMWTITTCVFKYKFYTVKKSSVRFVSYTLIIVGLWLLSVFENYMISVDSLFGQAEFPFFYTVGILFNIIFILLPVSKNNQQE